MKLGVFACFLVLAVPAFSENQPNDNRAAILGNIDRIEALYLPRLSGKELQDAVRLINDTRALVAALPPVPSTSVNSVSNLLSDEGLQALVESVKKESFDHYRTDIILPALGKTGRITVAQVRVLCNLYSDDSDKRDLLIGLRGNIVDPVNISLALTNFTFSHYRDEVLKAYKDQ